jgi:hypothetical protein
MGSPWSSKTSFAKLEHFKEEPVISFLVDSDGKVVFRQQHDVFPLHELPLEKTDLMVNYLRVSNAWNIEFSQLHLSLYIECLRRERFCECSLFCLDDKQSS